ncbi:MAG: AIM24 family protein [Coriobacteriaceae bacterium]|nr:AIM24 family protein [Coriobacteriaceae bacterium]
MYTIKNFKDNDDVRVLDSKGPFSVIEYRRDLSVSPYTATMEYFSSKMNIRRRQVCCELIDGSGVILQAGAMQWMTGDIGVKTGVKGVGDFASKMLRGAATGETAVKPEYKGDGTLVLEPTYRHILLMSTDEWGGGVVLDDGLFLACEDTLRQRTVARSNVSSAVFGGEGLFNLMLEGQGVFAIEADCPKEELVEVELRNDVLKIDGNLALCWTPGLQFTTERTTRSLVGSAASGEGLVNVYRGTGKVLMMPVRSRAGIHQVPVTN